LAGKTPWLGRFVSLNVLIFVATTPAWMSETLEPSGRAKNASSNAPPAGKFDLSYSGCQIVRPQGRPRCYLLTE
jgi:hypothetical protein